MPTVTSSSCASGRTARDIERGDDKAPIPADLAPDELTPERAEELLAKGGSRAARRSGTDPDTGMPVLALSGRFGPFVQLGESAGRIEGEAEAGVAVRDHGPVERSRSTRRLQLLSLPRVVGVDADGEEITAQNGRYGPYLKKGTDTRSLGSEDQIFTVTLADAEALFAQPKQRRGRVAKPPLAELGAHPGVGRAGTSARRPVRPLRHRRDDQRDRAARHRSGVAHARAGY